jgi:penicillin-binding protein 1A
MFGHPTRRAAVFGAFLALLTTSCAQLTDLPTLTKDDLKFEPPQSSRIYASGGELITTLHGEQNRTVIYSLDRIPQHVRDAVVAIEDQRFYEHDGVDLQAIIRALVTNATSGEVQQGGSTITQQYVKNAIIAPNRTAAKTFRRKINEAALARQLETKWSKDKILLRYLNTVYFGEGAYGIQAAAKTYFGKTAGKLTLAEGAALAAIIRSPEDYDPFKHPAANRDRRALVIDRMESLDFIDPVRAARATAAKLDLQPASRKDQYAAPYFVDYVQRLITYDPRFKMLGRDPEERTKQLFQGGLKIYTTVNLDDQAAAEAAVESQTYEDGPHASLVSIDPNSGHVRAMVGGRDWFAAPKEDPYAKLNLAILAEPDLGHVKPVGSKKYEDRAPGTGRQGGSAFKSFALAAAVKEGVSLSERFKAAGCMDFAGADAGGNWHVCNYDGGSAGGGKISLLEGTVNSVNVVYAQLILKIGAEAVVETAEEMGIKTPLLAVPSAALGTNPVNPMGMASAYGTLATGGVHHDPVAITKIEDEDGDVVYRDKTKGERVLDPAVAYITTSALEQVVLRGTGTNAQIGRPVAGKTGTAQEWRDAWFVGYTPDLVTSVWMGYPQGEIEMKPACTSSTSACIPTQTITSGGVTGGSFPALIWNAFMSRALAGVPADDFDAPDIGIITVTIDTRNGCLAGRFTPEEYQVSATFAEGTEPEETCREPGDRSRGVTVPDVFGFPAAEGADVLERAGFAVSRTTEATSSYPPGRIIAQSPDGGEKAPRGSTVTIVVSEAGENEGTVPDVLGQSRSSAESELRSAGFAVRIITEKESSPGQAKKNSGRVWKQDPAGGSSAERGSTVTIWVNP